jgi:hypothetical protein
MNKREGSIISDEECLNHLTDLSPHHRHHRVADLVDLWDWEGQQCKITRISQWAQSNLEDGIKRPGLAV